MIPRLFSTRGIGARPDVEWFSRRGNVPLQLIDDISRDEYAVEPHRVLTPTARHHCHAHPKRASEHDLLMRSPRGCAHLSKRSPHALTPSALAPSGMDALLCW
jgi:hypothetical protein